MQTLNEQEVLFKDLHIDVFKDFLNRKSYMCLLNPGGDLFQFRPTPQQLPEDEFKHHGLLIDMQSVNLICTIYDGLSQKNKDTFNNVICKKEYKFASYLGKMWGWVKK